MKIQLFLKISVLKNFGNFSGKHLCCRPEGLQLYYKETPIKVTSCKNFKNIFLYRITPVAALVTIYSKTFQKYLLRTTNL